MNEKKYDLPNGKTAVFYYDENGVGKITLECMDALMEKMRYQWVSCSERLPEDTDPVNITWVNHNPEPYYAAIKDEPFTATGCYCDGKWYWYSVTCQDYLDEYRYCDVDSMDEAIEVIAWMPLPSPYREEQP